MPNSPFPIIAYFPSWKGSLKDVDFRKLTHVNYSFVMPTPEGGITPPEDAILKELVKQGHAHDVKVCVAVGGWNDGDCTPFEKMAADPAARARFVRCINDLCDLYGLDGVDIDWEYPKAQSAGHFRQLMLELEDAMRSRGRLLSLAVIAEGDEFGKHIPDDVFARIDFLNLMAYDWHYQREGVHHSPFSVAESSLDYWLSRGCPKEKAVLGVPFYGRSTSKYISYRDLLALDPEAHRKDEQGGILYNGVPTMREKTRLAKRRGGGIMFWEITQDTMDERSLLAAIHEEAIA